MERYQLKTFVTVAGEWHLTRASERLRTSQSALSTHIKAPEEDIRQVWNAAEITPAPQRPPTVEA